MLEINSIKTQAEEFCTKFCTIFTSKGKKHKKPQKYSAKKTLKFPCKISEYDWFKTILYPN